MQKKINPVNMWNNGKNETAVYLDLFITKDNLHNEAVFYYSLLNEVVAPETLEAPIPDADNLTKELPTVATKLVPGYSLAEGNITISGTDYSNWDNSNDAALAIVCQKLGLTY